MGLGWLVWNLLNGFANCGPRCDKFASKICWHFYAIWSIWSILHNSAYPTMTAKHTEGWTNSAGWPISGSGLIYVFSSSLSWQKRWTHGHEPLALRNVEEFQPRPVVNLVEFLASQQLCHRNAQYGYPCNRKVTAIQGTRRHVYRGLGSSDWRSAFRMCWAHNEGNLRDVFLLWQKVLIIL